MFRSTVFRVALAYAGLFGLAAVVLIGFIYWSTAGYMLREADATIEAEIAALADRYSSAGLSGLTTLIRQRLARTPAGDAIYLLADADRNPLIGNLDRWPAVEAGSDGWIEFRLGELSAGDIGSVRSARARAFSLRGGYLLLVGRDMQELDASRALIARTLGWGLAATLLAALGGAVLLSRGLRRRLAAVNAGIGEIMAGDLSRRLPSDGTADDFDRLIGNLNRMLDRIEALVEAVRQVSDNIAHDLRTPLTRLRQRLEAVRSGRGDDRELVQQAIGDADALLDTFAALLRIARVEAREGTEGFERVELDTLVADVVELYEPLAEQRGQHLSACSGGGGHVQGDRDLLFQVLANLVDNAIKHTPDGSRIGVASSGGSTPRLRVADDGPGIPAPERERVLQRFYRLDDSRGAPGNGLGLSLVAAVVELHGARIELLDNDPGLVAELTFAEAS